LIRTIYAYIIIVLSLILTIIGYLFLQVLKLFIGMETQKSYVHFFASTWGKICVGTSGSIITVTGSEKIPNTNVLFVSNHQSNYDIPLLLSRIPRPIAFVAKVEIAKIPLMSHWMKEMGCIFLDRSDIRQSLKVMQEGTKRLEDGYNMVIFPEGTRSKDGTMSEFKQGSLRLATKANVPIIPVSIINSGNMWEYSGRRITKTQAEIIFHDPIYPDKLSKEEVKELHKTVHKIVEGPLIGGKTKN